MKITEIIKFIFSCLYEENSRFRLFNKIGVFNVYPDEIYLKKLFKFRLNRELDLNNPKSFNEKLQWLKLHDRNPLYTTLVDKYLVKEYISNIIGKEYIIPNLGVWDSFDKIDFTILPNQFVLKCTHDSGGLVVCKNKRDLNIKLARKKINDSLNTNYYLHSREWPYKNVKPQIIAEKFMEDETQHNTGLIDYKFFCFNGEPKLLYISVGLENHKTAKISFYDMFGKELNFHRSDYKPYHNAFIPKNFNEMKNIAGIIAKSINNPFVRIDLYSINNKVYFSEVTFSPCGGMIPFDSIKADIELGELLSIKQGY